MSNSLTITNQYPVEKFNLLTSMQTIAEIPDIQKAVMNVVSISTDLNDKEIYEQEKGYIGRDGRPVPPKYAITKKGLTKLMRAAGIKMLSSRPVLPSTCQRCVEVNKHIGKAVNCGGCPSNKDVKHEVRICVPQLTGENIEIVAHKEIFVNDVAAGMSEKQKAEFLKFRGEMCESKALNRALRTAMQIKGTYTLDEFKKPFVVAYLVPNLDNEAVKEKAIESFFASKTELYGSKPEVANTIFVDTDNDYDDDFEPEAEAAAIVEAVPIEAELEAGNEIEADDPNMCVSCGIKITSSVSAFSTKKYGQPLCMACQKQQGGTKQ